MTMQHISNKNFYTTHPCNSLINPAHLNTDMGGKMLWGQLHSNEIFQLHFLKKAILLLQ